MFFLGRLSRIGILFQGPSSRLFNTLRTKPRGFKSLFYDLCSQQSIFSIFPNSETRGEVITKYNTKVFKGYYKKIKNRKQQRLLQRMGYLYISLFSTVLPYIFLIILLYHNLSIKRVDLKFF